MYTVRTTVTAILPCCRSDLKNHMIKYSQFFPEKYLQGNYEIEGKLFDYPLNNKGKFNLSLCK